MAEKPLLMWCSKQPPQPKMASENGGQLRGEEPTKRKRPHDSNRVWGIFVFRAKHWLGRQFAFCELG